MKTHTKQVLDILNNATFIKSVNNAVNNYQNDWNELTRDELSEKVNKVTATIKNAIELGNLDKMPNQCRHTIHSLINQIFQFVKSPQANRKPNTSHNVAQQFDQLELHLIQWGMILPNEIDLTSFENRMTIIKSHPKSGNNENENETADTDSTNVEDTDIDTDSDTDSDADSDTDSNSDGISDSETHGGAEGGYGCVEFCELHNNSLEILQEIINESDCSITFFPAYCDELCGTYCDVESIVEYDIADACLEETESLTCDVASEMAEGINFYSSDFPNCEESFMVQLGCSFD